MQLPGLGLPPSWCVQTLAPRPRDSPLSLLWGQGHASSPPSPSCKTRHLSESFQGLLEAVFGNAGHAHSMSSLTPSAASAPGMRHSPALRPHLVPAQSAMGRLAKLLLLRTTLGA